MAEIPTMPCPECAGLGSFYDRPEACERCDETGRVDRPPLTPEEVAAVDVPAQVITAGATGEAYATHGYPVLHVGTLATLAGMARRGTLRVWLADDGGEG